MNGFTGVAVESAPFSLDRGHFNDKIRRVSPPILAICRRGGPMCPRIRDILWFLPTFGEFVVPTTGGHMVYRLV